MARLMAFAVAAFALPGAAAALPTVHQGSVKVAIADEVRLYNTGALNFGNIAATNQAGTVTINAATGARTSTGGVVLLGGTTSPAGFAGEKSGLLIVLVRAVAAPVTLNRIGGGATMRITAFTNTNPVTLLPLGRAYTFKVGGTLAVGANQMEGQYEATFPVTIDYL